ncbi:calcium-binding protein [Brasilonema octagenarum UFV-E1]|uniref:Calcium-binding protein n=2 Tax=Brasilonema TaxID=383614 RepID=A0A856MDU1_9CYAN|nr:MULTISPECIES: EF-hand domain-containing protein [Brasilonema]NMF62778.1 calcium-binding protein [Brasilonema octagenarum UFV-OR1]QDL08470.1 calcium-binding protein [Brasilonema sennae CENA114]QDL14826.1 calcium-binding protein [Brasilonema octagenarum UFV-E1]
MSVAAPQDLLDRKFDVCFTHADIDGNGFFEWEDVLALATRIADCLGEPKDSPKGQKLFQTFTDFWTYVQAKMDVDNDGKVSPEEWRNGLRNAFAKDPEAYKAGFRPLAEATFKVCDRDGDGSLEQSEFAKFHEAFGCKSANSELAFQKLDSDGDGELTVDELLSAWEEYYTSNDPNARGNWLYGDVWDETVVVGSKIIR